MMNHSPKVFDNTLGDMDLNCSSNIDLSLVPWWVLQFIWVGFEWYEGYIFVCHVEGKKWGLNFQNYYILKLYLMVKHVAC